MSLLNDDSFTVSLESGPKVTSPSDPPDIGPAKTGDLTIDVQKLSNFSLRRRKDKPTKKSHSKTPPDSPKIKQMELLPGPPPGATRKTSATKGTTGNTKARKHYSTLMENEESSPDEEGVDDNFLLSKGHVAREKRSSSNPTSLKPNPPTVLENFTETSSGFDPLQFPVQFTPPVEARFPEIAPGASGNILDNDFSQLIPPSRPLPVPVSAPQLVEVTDEPDWSVSDELHQKCIQQFDELRPENGYLSGEKARDFFIQSKLPVDELSKIWKLSDIDHDGRLTLDEFVIAMKLVLMRRRAYNIPSVLPDVLHPKITNKQTDISISIPPPPPKTTPIEESTFELLPPPRPPPPAFLTSGNRAKTEPSIAISDVTPLPVTNNKEASLVQEPRPLEPMLGKLISLEQGEDSSTGDEDELSVLVAGGITSTESAPVPKPRKKKRSPQKKEVNKLISGELGRSNTIHGGPPPRPPPYKSSPLHKSIGPKDVPTSETIISNVDQSNKGHGRSTSWDLTKLLKEGSLGVHDDLPSAEPPKLPPRKNIISPSSDDEGTSSKVLPVPLQRSASTGSIASIGNTQAVLNTSTTSRSPSNDSVSTTEPLPLISRTGSDSIRRQAPPPPKVKPKKPMYPPSYKKVGSSPERNDENDKAPLSMDSYKKKTKIELQKSIKQLKEENDVYSRMNSELSNKLKELIEERHRLETRLETLKHQ